MPKGDERKPGVVVIVLTDARRQELIERRRKERLYDEAWLASCCVAPMW